MIQFVRPINSDRPHVDLKSLIHSGKLDYITDSYINEVVFRYLYLFIFKINKLIVSLLFKVRFCHPECFLFFYFINSEAHIMG